MTKPIQLNGRPQKTILIYTFYRWQCSTYKALRHINHPNVKSYYFRGKSGLNTYLNYICKYKFKYIIGIADYRKTARRVRVEGRFINKYGKNKILENGKEIYKPNLQLPQGCSIKDKQRRIVKSYIADTSYNGPCNRSAYLTMDRIQKQNLDSKYAFVHIPRSLPIAEIERLLSCWIVELSE